MQHLRANARLLNEAGAILEELADQCVHRTAIELRFFLKRKNGGLATLPLTYSTMANESSSLIGVVDAEWEVTRSYSHQITEEKG
jgi:hypothetical protein